MLFMSLPKPSFADEHRVLAQDEVRMPEPKHMRLRDAVPKATCHFITKGLPEAICKRHDNEEEKMRLRKIPRHLLEIYGRSYFQVLGEQKPPLRRGAGLQLLVTCKQVYRECLGIFYSSNTFVLPPGQVEHTKEHFLVRGLAPKFHGNCDQTHLGAILYSGRSC